MDLTQQAKDIQNITVQETNKNNSESIECSKITMDLKFNNSRKYISITVPSKTQTMSPHIKSVDDVVVLGMNLSKFNKLTQFFICVAGVFVFYLIYGYLQVKKLYVCNMLIIYNNRGQYGHLLVLPEIVT
uniref:Solute carrier family 35 member B3 n=1 Tax=Gorilla gorilla gorilla TaxID=9595 RepID=A0A2I2ZCI8_GORGO